MNSFNPRYFGLSILFTIVVTTACSTTEEAVSPEEETGYYLSHPGSEQIRTQIKEGFESVIRLHNQVSYRTYLFDVEGEFSANEVVLLGIEEYAVDSFTDVHSNAGTGVIIDHGDGETLILTAAHSVSHPDTIWHYSNQAIDEGDGIVRAVSIKEYTAHYTFGPQGMSNFEVGETDSRRDLALLRKSWRAEEDPGFIPIQIPKGNQEELEWADRFYALGYPKGFQMVTSGMISRSQSAEARMRFMVDSSMNRGFSGGPLFAIRGDGSGLEWIGVLSAAYAEREYFLAPDETQTGEALNQQIEYEGPLYLRMERRIRYGITYAVGIGYIEEFLEANR